MERDPEQALDDIGTNLARGDEPDADARAFLEGVKADPQPSMPEDTEPPDRF